MAPDRGLAERVLLEILRQAGDGGLGRIKLYKAFWLAHLYYTNENPGYLSNWPVVRMPQGPGVDQGTTLLDNLQAAGAITQTVEQVGPFQEYRSRYCNMGRRSELSDAAIAAIKTAVEYVKGMTAAELSEISHDYSRSWRNTPDGLELDIYTDLIPEETFAERTADLAQANQAIADLFR